MGPALRGSGHSGDEWRDDGALAEAFYAALPAITRFIFDLLMDRPGERLTADWIAAQLAQRPGNGARMPGRRSVSASLSFVSQPHKRSGRRLPFYWWRHDGEASSYAMKPTVARLFREARQNIDGTHVEPGSRDWSAAEIAAVVGDYLAMLQAEIAGQPYSVAGHRRALLPRLSPARTEAAVEYLHQSISTAMLDLGLPYLRSYQPVSSDQAILTAEIQRHLEADPALLQALRGRPDDGTPPHGRLQRMSPPASSVPPVSSAGTHDRTGRHPDYGLLHEENRRRGKLGEELVIDYERARLREQGRPDLADAIRWTAREDGDGLGYDVLSFDLNGRERYIEVKATAHGEGTPFYLSSAELDFAQHHADRYALYRVYDIDGEPRFFALRGDITAVLELIPVTYSARITATAPDANSPGDASDSPAAGRAVRHA
jgi:hypothetical protein